MQQKRNSIHIAIRLWERCVFLRAASLASDECENVRCGLDSPALPSSCVILTDKWRLSLRAIWRHPFVEHLSSLILRRHNDK